MSAPVTRLRRARNALSPGEWRRASAMAGAVVLLHILGWGIFLFAIVPRHYGLGIGVAITAYTLGLRHAFDADHIAAIDNTTRKFMAEGRRPLSVGFFFSIGHSSVVFALGVAITLAAKTVFGAVKNPHSALASFGGVFGTSISGVFLYLIAGLNVVILIGIVKIFLGMRRGLYDEDQLEEQLQARGLMFRFFGRFMRSISKEWHMYPIGVLFGLGFDTATEVALLGTTAGAAASHLPWYSVLALPILFAAGMSLLDTIDGSFMNFAYGWAFSRPIRKVYYNITITGLSVAVAFVVGTIELLGLVATELHLRGGLWGQFATFNINLAGFIIAGMFVAVWVIALGIWRFGDIESRWEASAERHRCERAELVLVEESA